MWISGLMFPQRELMDNTVYSSDSISVLECEAAGIGNIYKHVWGKNSWSLERYPGRKREALIEIFCLLLTINPGSCNPSILGLKSHTHLSDFRFRFELNRRHLEKNTLIICCQSVLVFSVFWLKNVWGIFSITHVNVL